MMKLLLLVILAATGCEPRLPMQPLPALAVARAPLPAPVLKGLWNGGEELIWSVHSRGMQIGTATLTVSEDLEVTSRFIPERWLAGLRSLHHRLETGPKSHLGVHSLHSTLGWIRAWARPKAAPTTIEARHGKRRFRIAVATPIEEPPLLRIDVVANEINGSGVAIALWLSDDDRRVPTRIEMTLGKRRITAHLISNR